MTPAVRKFALTAHVTSSVSWLGAVTAFLALAVAGLTSHDAHLVRAAYVATEAITWFVIVPLVFAALATGLIVSLGTPWGLFRHYWVLVKFMVTILATALLLLHTRPIGILSGVAREMAPFSDFRGLQIQLVGDAGAALVALLVNVMLSVYKPHGMTAYGRRRQLVEQSHVVERETGYDAAPTPRWIKAFAVIILGLMLVFVIVHLAGGGLGALHHR
jgi:hypothetical protein